MQTEPTWKRGWLKEDNKCIAKKGRGMQPSSPQLPKWGGKVFIQAAIYMYMYHKLQWDGLLISTCEDHYQPMHIPWRWLFFAGTNVWYFCGLAQKCKILYPLTLVIRTTEHWNVSTLYHYRVQITKFSTHKTCFKPKSQKNVPANNYHPKIDSHSYLYANCVVLVTKNLSLGMQTSISAQCMQTHPS